MEIDKTHLAGLLLIKPKAFGDERGFFLETYSRDRYREGGIDAEFVQANHSRSVRGVLRGLHFQTDPGQAKLVYCPRGKVWDVAVDIRKNSSTFGQYFSVELSDANHYQLYIPVGFAHGFCVTSEVADFTYMVGSLYGPATESGIAYDDPRIRIDWPLKKEELIISGRDQDNPTLKDYDWKQIKWKL